MQVMIFTERTIIPVTDFAGLGLVFHRFCISKFYMRFGLKTESIAKNNFEKPLFHPQSVLMKKPRFWVVSHSSSVFINT